MELYNYDANEHQKELDLKNPIFVLYLNLDGHSKLSSENIISNFRKNFNIYSNITVWIIASKHTELKCIWPLNNTEYPEYFKNLVNIIENSKSFEQLKSDVISYSRSFKIDSFVD